jgi:plastocyanin
VPAAAGRVHTVRMGGAGGRNAFDPMELTVARGDTVRFVLVGGGPHNVAFSEEAPWALRGPFRVDSGSAVGRLFRGWVGAGIPPGSAERLAASIAPAAAPLASQMLLDPGDTVRVAFAGLPAGRYAYACTPHMAMGMYGVIVVR